MRLAPLLDALPEKTVNGSCDRTIRSIAHDSRLVEPGDLFVALDEPSGNDGHRFIDAAMARGAAVIVYQQNGERIPCPDPLTVTAVRVPNTHEALARLAACFFDYPARRLRMIGVTGTNGKTTVTYLVEAILRAAGWRCGLIGTAGNRMDGLPLSGPQSHTTPYPEALHRMLKTIADQGGEYVVMEVSSHGLALDRLTAIAFDIAVFTNLTRDHLDFHQTFDAYLEAKKHLFSTGLVPTGTAVINGDDPAADAIADTWRGKKIAYGAHPDADLRLDEPVVLTAEGSTFMVRSPDGSAFQVSIPLVGRFNVSNALAAIGVAVALGIPGDIIQTGMTEVSVPGRMERVACGQPFAVLVDYAHTPDALRSVLTSAREWTRGRLIAVVGCGGDRDRGKRPEMGRIAADIADFVIITSDNPRTEAPAAILRDIEQGIPATARYRSIVDRRTAIAEALDLARPADTVLIAGKGHETYQIIGAIRIDFDDRLVARQILEDRFGASTQIPA